MATFSTAVMDQATDVIHGLQVQLEAREVLLAKLRGELESAQREIARLRGDMDALRAKVARQSRRIKKSEEVRSW